MDIVVMITEFNNHLKAGGYASSTVECYSQYLGYFKDYLTEKKIEDVKKITHKIIREYQEMVMARSLAMETKALRIRPVKRLFGYLVETHRLLIDPTEGIVETNRKNRNIQPVLSIKEIKKLLEQPNLSYNGELRNRAIIEILYSTGIRLNELLSLQIFDVDLKEKTLFIRKGKGKRQRVVPLGKSVAHLKEYLEKIRPLWTKKHPRERKLFVTNSGLPLAGQSVRGFLRVYRIKAGIKTPISPHTFRRTCATHLVQQGADIRYVQKLLGHRHLRTTHIYTKIKPADVKKIHKQTHPNGTIKKKKGNKKNETN